MKANGEEASEPTRTITDVNDCETQEDADVFFDSSIKQLEESWFFKASQMHCFLISPLHVRIVCCLTGCCCCLLQPCGCCL